MDEACEAISVFVDDLWKLGGPAYTEERMKSFLDVIGNEVAQLIQNYLSAVLVLILFIINRVETTRESSKSLRNVNLQSFK